MKPTKFNFTDEEFLAIINQICEKETAMNVEFTPLTSMDDSIDADRLDSLGMIIFYTWLAELFNIPDESVTVFLEREEFTVSALKHFVTVEGTRTYSYAEAEEFTKRCF